MKRVKFRDTLLLCEILRLTYRGMRESGCGPRDVLGKFSEATSHVLKNLGDGRKAMYHANYGKRAMKGARTFDFTALFHRLDAIAQRSDLAERFSQFSAKGDGRLDAVGLRELLLHVDPKLISGRERHAHAHAHAKKERGQRDGSGGGDGGGPVMLMLRFALLHAVGGREGATCTCI